MIWTPISDFLTVLASHFLPFSSLLFFYQGYGNIVKISIKINLQTKIKTSFISINGLEGEKYFGKHLQSTKIWLAHTGFALFLHNKVSFGLKKKVCSSMQGRLSDLYEKAEIFFLS